MLSRLFSALSGVCSGVLFFATATLAQTTINVGPGQSYTTIQSAINAASSGDEILVAPGTYKENIDFSGKNITLISSGGAAATIIDGDGTAPAVQIKHGETSAAVLAGFTIQHGGAFGWVTAFSTYGIGNIYLQNSAPTIRNNIITRGNCWGIESNASAPLIGNNTISDTQDPIGNCSFGGGAAILIWGGLNGYNHSNINSGQILGNTIENNTESGLEDAGGNGGAGIAVWGGSPLIMNNIIRNNASPRGSGGAINFINSEGTIIAQNLIYGNSAGCGGGAIATDGNGLYVLNNTIVDNVGKSTGGFSECANIAQIYPDPLAYGGDSPGDVFINNIISGSTSYPAVNCSWFNAPSLSTQPTFENNILYNAGGQFFGSYCIDVSNLDNNIAADPQFISPSTGDYHLKSSSPAIDSGQNSVLQTFLTATGQSWLSDYAGNARLQNGGGKGCIIDMGAYEYGGTSSDCNTFETLASSLNPARAGQSVTFTAQLSSTQGTPTGSVEFMDGSTILATQTLSTSGAASYSTSTLSVGSHSITALYLPTGNFSNASASLVQEVDSDPSTTLLTCQPATFYINGTAQLSATVSSSYGTPTGSITFADAGSALGTMPLLNGAASMTYTGQSWGQHTLTATYAPTGAFAASSGTCIVLVNSLPTTSTLNVTPTTSTYGSTLTLTATVSPANTPAPSTPTGNVTFYDGATTIGTAALGGGVAQLTTSSLSGGSHSLSCAYGGSALYATSQCSPVAVSIQSAPTTLTLTANANPAAYLSPITLTAVLTTNGKSAGAGNVLQLSINGQTIALTTDATGTASYSVSNLAAGSYPVTVSFAATSSLLASSAALTEVIQPVATTTTLTAAPSPGVVNQAVALTATVASSSAPVGAGSVTFYDGSAMLGSAQLTAAGTASLSATFTSTGIHTLSAVYGGTSNYLGSSSAAVQESIQAGDFSITAAPGSASIYTGEATTVQVSVAALLGFNQRLALSCAGLPANTSCSFSPSSLTNGQGTTNLTIQTTAPQQIAKSYLTLPGALLLLALFVPWMRSRRALARWIVLLLAAALGMTLAGCASTNSIAGGTAPGTYQIAVTATTEGSSTPLTHSAVITLTVKSLF